MRFFKVFALMLSVLWLSACASNPNKFEVQSITSLAAEDPAMAEFRGLEFLADPIPGKLKSRVNIFYLHGIGWTEDPDADPLGNNFLSGIARAYNLDHNGQFVASPCGETLHDGDTHENNHIYITAGSEPTVYESAIPGAVLKLDRMVCMDKQTLEVDSSLEFVVYRIFWDDIFWNRLQFPHVGQDDDRGSSSAFAGLRRKYNRKLKDDLVNYGFSDAVLYLGPAGKDIRNAIRGAMCSAAIDASGYELKKQGEETSYQRACATASNTSIMLNQFAFVTESLGSKIAYDVMRESMTDGRETIIDDMIAGSEIYMLANQLALLSLSDLTTTPKPLVTYASDKARPKIVALSEINDFLSYEINPFFKQLWQLQAVPGDGSRPEFDHAARQSIADALGFDFVDLRLEFADPIIPFVKEFVDPLQAHLEHAAEPELMLYLICGVRAGKLNLEGCLATGENPA